MTNKLAIMICVCILCFINASTAQTVAGKIDAKTNNGTLVYHGTAMQIMLSGTVFNNHQVFNLTVDNASGVNSVGSSYLNIFGTLSLLNGTYTTNDSLYIIGNISAGSGKLQTGNTLLGMFGVTAAQSLPFNIFPNNRVGNLCINNPYGVNITGWGGVNGTLMLQVGTLATGGTFIIGGNISYTAGGISAGNDTIKFSGTSPQTLPDGTFINSTVARLSIDNNFGISSSGTLAITNCLNVSKLNTSSIALSAAGKPFTITGSKLVVSGFDTQPTVGQTYTIIACGSLIGNFTSVTLPAGVTGDVSYTSTDAILTITSTNVVLAFGPALNNFTGNTSNNQGLLSWRVDNHIELAKLEIERGVCNSCFLKIGVSSASANGYFTDKTPLSGVNYYRIKMVKKNGGISYSKQVALVFVQEMMVYPNPVINEAIVTHERATASAILSIYNALGTKVLEKKVAENAVKSTINLQQLPTGTYSVVFANAGAFQTKLFIANH